MVIVDMWVQQRVSEARNLLQVLEGATKHELPLELNQSRIQCGRASGSKNAILEANIESILSPDGPVLNNDEAYIDTPNVLAERTWQSMLQKKEENQHLASCLRETKAELKSKESELKGLREEVASLKAQLSGKKSKFVILAADLVTASEAKTSETKGFDAQLTELKEYADCCANKLGFALDYWNDNQNIFIFSFWMLDHMKANLEYSFLLESAEDQNDHNNVGNIRWKFHHVTINDECIGGVIPGIWLQDGYAYAAEELVNELNRTRNYVHFTCEMRKLCVQHLKERL